MSHSSAEVLIRQLSDENRRIFADWRALILLRRASLTVPPEQRRWSRIPESIGDIRAVLRGMERRGAIRIVMSRPRIYAVTVPYAQRSPISEDEVLMEVNPYAALAYLSALRFHELTEQLPQELLALIPRQASERLLPPDTYVEDWSDLAPPPSSKPTHVLTTPVRWVTRQPGHFFGINDYHPRGYAVRVTDVERTLLDGLLYPDLCGGFANVLQAWLVARDILRVETLIGHVDRFDIGVLRQRVGYLLEELDFSHPTLTIWQASALRGGSSRLVASEPYSASYSERWNLSLNASVEDLLEVAL